MSINGNELYHYGILGMKWGVRRFQNKDGTRTTAGKAREKLSRKEKEDLMYKPIGKTLNKTYHEKQVITTKAPDGTELTMEQLDKSSFARLLARGSKKIQQAQLNDKNFNIKIGNKIIGNMEITQISPKEVNGVWLDINEKNRGNGYATAVLMTTLSECKKRGYNRFTLEVPGISPDARHIYEKLGFVAGEKIGEDDDVWGGLTKMELDLKKYSWG